MIDDYALRTPEAVSISYDVAGIGSRFMAAVVDILILAVAIIIIGIAGIFLSIVPGVSPGTAVIIAGTLTFLLFWGYFAVFEALWHGQTPGKRLSKIRVLRTSGYPIGFFESLVRNIVRIVDFLPVFYGIGVLTMFISPESRRLGDYAAGTLVVKERQYDIEQLTPVMPKAEVSPQPARGVLDAEELDWKLDSLTSEDLRVIDEFLRRAAKLTPKARRTLGDEITSHVVSRIGARLPHDPVHFLQRVVYLHSSDDE
jgi:uncharacterized RDD family membrane protein YckC